MSGVICEIIIRGNRVQANAQALCTLANGYAEGGTWDDLMTDPQKFKAAAMLQDFLDKSDRLLLEITNNP